MDIEIIRNYAGQGETRQSIVMFILFNNIKRILCELWVHVVFARTGMESRLLANSKAENQTSSDAFDGSCG